MDTYNMNPRQSYNYIISEHFNILDTRTREVLLNIDESDKDQVLGTLATKLYKNIVDKVDDIDYAGIPESKGDITQIPHYPELCDCLDNIEKIIVHYKDDTTSVNIIKQSIENLKDSKKLWEKAFFTKCELPMVFYNTISLAIVSSVSLILSTCIDYINVPEQKTFTEVLDKTRLHKSKDHLLLKNLEKFNKAYKKKEIEKTMSALLNAQRAAVEEEVVSVILGGIVATATLLSLILLTLPIIHELVYMFYSARQSISEYFDYQATCVLMNAEKVKERSTKTPEKREKIYKRQIKIAEKFRKISNFFAIKFKNSENKAQQMVKQDENNKYKIDDVMNNETDSDSHSSIF